MLLSVSVVDLVRLAYKLSPALTNGSTFWLGVLPVCRVLGAFKSFVVLKKLLLGMMTTA